MTTASPNRLANAAIRQRFTTLWGNLTPIRRPNRPEPTPSGDYVRIDIIGPSETAGSLGSVSKLTRWTGYVQITILLPENTGEDRADAYADRVMQIFHHQHLYLGGRNAIKFWATDVSQGGVINGRWTVYASTRFDADFSFSITPTTTSVAAAPAAAA